MNGARLEKAGGVFAGVRGGFIRAENDLDAGRSSAGVEGMTQQTPTVWVETAYGWRCSASPH